MAKYFLIFPVPQSIILINRGADPARLAASRNQPVTEILKCLMPDDIALANLVFGEDLKIRIVWGIGHTELLDPAM